MPFEFLICFALIFSGGALTILAGMRYAALQRKFNIPLPAEQFRTWLKALSVIVCIGCIAILGCFFFCTPTVTYLLTCLVLFLCGLSIFCLVKDSQNSAAKLYEERCALENALAKIEHANKHFEQALSTRVGDVMQQDKLLQIVNTLAATLLGLEVENFDHTLLACMEKMGLGVDVDRVYIWKNHLQGGLLYCTQIYEWSGGAEPQQGNELTVSVPFPENWYPDLSTNRCVNGAVKSFSGFERKHLEAQGILSIIVVPVFLHNEFWGFVGFDDCHSERAFSKGEEAALRSVSILFASAMLRNEMMTNLMKAKEEALSSAKAKTDFLANVSHEIRTPMNAITGMTSIARMTGDKKKIDKCLDHIEAASRQLMALINDVLDMSKIEAGKLELAEEAFEFVPLLHNVKGLVSVRALEKKQTLSMEFLPPLPKVLIGDDLRISQILLNLLSNAVKFTPEGGEIRLRVSSVTSAYDGYVDLAFAVSDTGIGIAPEDMERLFSKFEQADKGISRRFGGTGLGLAICKKITALMHGGIEVRSVPGQGSTFTAHLRVKQGTEEMLPQKRTLELPTTFSFPGKYVLLVDDIEVNREVVASLVENTGVIVDIAENGLDAVEKFKTAPDKYDLILMDVQMPVMDGYTATEKIRDLKVHRAKTIPILALTANAFKEDVERSLAAGMNGHIAKPVQYESLMERLSAYLGDTHPL
ncbi:MAG: Sensor histidine kinase RcsC [Desulfovibrio sp.]